MKKAELYKIGYEEQPDPRDSILSVPWHSRFNKPLVKPHGTPFKGKSMIKLAPLPTSLSIAMVPACAATICLLM